MGVRITDSKNVSLYCSTSMTAFGPMFNDEYEAEDFLAWLSSDDGAREQRDPRSIPPAEFETLVKLFRDEQEAAA